MNEVERLANILADEINGKTRKLVCKRLGGTEFGLICQD